MNLNIHYVTFIRTTFGNYNTIPTDNRKVAEMDGITLEKELKPLMRKGLRILYNRTITVDHFDKIWNNK
jgi:hypothetical protein